MVMEVVVRKTTRGPGFKKTLQVNENDTLYQLKSRIFEVFGISPNSQYLHCFGRDLDGDTQTLERLGVKDESVIFIIQNASVKRKGDSDDESKSIQEHVVKPGLNYESLCNNPACRLYQQQVVVNVGYRSKSIFQKDRWESNKCPQCGETCSEIGRAIFKECSWKSLGYTTKGTKIQDEGVSKEEDSPINVSSNKWSYLEFTILRLP